MSKALEIVHGGPEAIRKETGGASLVVLYPRNHYRNAYLSRFLKDSETGLFYYALQTTDRNLRKFLNNLIEDMEASYEDFGKNLRAALSAKGKASDLAVAMAEDLKTLSSEPFTLLLDQFDRLPEKDETKRFMEVLAEHIPPHAQVIINAREQAYLPWFGLVSEKRATVMGAEYVPEEAPPPAVTPDVPKVEVFSLGRGYTLVNGAPVTHWDGELPKNLFFFFMDHPLVTRDQIFDVFWPNLSVKEATNVFHVTKRKINERLGYDLTQYASGFYSHSEKVDLSYDVGQFTRSIEEAMMADEREEVRHWQRAVDLYRAPFLHRLDMDWAIERRKDLRVQHAQALIGLGRIKQANREFDLALKYYGTALRETPEREDIHRQVMELHYQQGNIDGAVAQFRQLERSLRETLNIGPSPETLKLYNLITGK